MVLTKTNLHIEFDNIKMIKFRIKTKLIKYNKDKKT